MSSLGSGRSDEQGADDEELGGDRDEAGHCHFHDTHFLVLSMGECLRSRNRI